MTLPKRLFRHLRMVQRTRLLPLVFWPLLAGYLSFIPPGEIIVFAGFYLLLAAATFFTLRFLLTLLQSSAISFAIVGYLVVRQLHLDTSSNLELLLAVALLGLYAEKIIRWSKKKYQERKDRPITTPASSEKEPQEPPRAHPSLVRSFPVDFLKE